MKETETKEEIVKNTLKIDELGRILIPKMVRDMLNLSTGEVSFYVDTNKGSITLYNRQYYGIKTAIETRLKNKGIGGSERNFLEKLLKNYDLWVIS